MHHYLPNTLHSSHHHYDEVVAFILNERKKRKNIFKNKTKIKLTCTHKYEAETLQKYTASKRENRLNNSYFCNIDCFSGE